MGIINIAKAAVDSTVTCSGSDCTVCGILETVGKIYNFLTGLSFAVAVLFLAMAGLVFIFGIGRKNTLIRAKEFARKAIIGFVFVLVGWLAIHAVLFSTGYKNAGNWWQFQCAVDLETGYNVVPLESFGSFANFADFMDSGNAQGIIKEAVSDAVFVDQLKKLKPGEKLTFYLTAKKADTQEDVIIPFLAGYKDVNGNIKIDASEADLMEKLQSMMLDGNLITLLRNKDFADRLFYILLNEDPSDMSLSEKINAARSAVADLRDQNPITPDSSAMAKISNRMMTVSLNDNPDGVVVNRTMTDSSPSSSSASSSSSGTSTGKSTDTKSGYNADKWPNTKQNQQDAEAKRVQDILSRGGSVDDMTDLINQNKDKKPPEGKSELCDGDWDPGDGTRMAVLKALRRIYRRDRLRYEMMFRFVDTVGVHEQGGECSACGKIKIIRQKAKILDIAHMLVHEGTHSGQFCLDLMGPYLAEGVGDQQNPGPGRGKIEAIACANQIGSIEKNQNHKNMDEFTKASDGTAIENLPNIKLGAGSGQGGTGQIRGHLARYWTEVNPRGDLDTGMITGIFEKSTQYPLKQGLPKNYYPAGQYHYGLCDSEKPKYLTLQDREEEVVKKIVTSKKECMSSPPKDLLPPCKPGENEEPLPQIEACKGAPEMNIE